MQSESSTEVINNQADPDVESLPKEEEDFESFMARVLNSDQTEVDTEINAKRDLESMDFLKVESETETTMEDFERTMNILIAMKPQSFGHALSTVMSSLAESDLTDAEREDFKKQINCVALLNKLDFDGLSKISGANYENEE